MSYPEYLTDIKIPSGKMSAKQYKLLCKKLLLFPTGKETARLLGYSVRGLQEFVQRDNVPVIVARFLRLIEKRQPIVFDGDIT